jgi:hypothetical protein
MGTRLLIDARPILKPGSRVGTEGGLPGINEPSPPLLGDDGDVGDVADTGDVADVGDVDGNGANVTFVSVLLSVVVDVDVAGWLLAAATANVRDNVVGGADRRGGDVAPVVVGVVVAGFFAGSACARLIS